MPSTLTGREVRCEHQTYEAHKAAAIGYGLTDAFAQGFVDMLHAKKEGLDTVAPRARAIVGAIFRVTAPTLS